MSHGWRGHAMAGQAIYLTGSTCCRGDCIAAAQDGVVYVVGGYYDSTDMSAAESFHQTLYALDTTVANPAWEERAAAPVPRGDGALVAMGGGRLLLVGGETHARNERTKVRSLRSAHTLQHYVVCRTKKQ